MQMDLDNVLAATMNAHRHQWNGSICSQPQSWNCGANPNFRENFCDTGVPSCFHLDVFKPSSPRFLTPDNSVVQAVQQQPKIFDDQVLVFYGRLFGALQGILPGDYEQTLFGIYRIKHASLDTSRKDLRLVIEPHADGWAIFPKFQLRPPTLRPIPGVSYLKQMRAKGLQNAVDEALEATKSRPELDGWSQDFQRRLQRAGDALPRWLQHAEEALARLPQPSEAPRLSTSFGNVEGSLAAKLKGIRIATTPSAQGPTLALWFCRIGRLWPVAYASRLLTTTCLSNAQYQRNAFSDRCRSGLHPLVRCLSVELSPLGRNDGGTGR